MRRRMRIRRRTHPGYVKWVLLGVYACVCFGLSCLPEDVPYSVSLRGFYFLSMAHIFTVPMFTAYIRAKPVDGANKTTGKPPSDGTPKPTGKPAADGPAPGKSGASAGVAGNPADICLW